MNADILFPIEGQSVCVCECTWKYLEVASFCFFIFIFYHFNIIIFENFWAMITRIIVEIKKIQK